MSDASDISPPPTIDEPFPWHFAMMLEGQLGIPSSAGTYAKAILDLMDLEHNPMLILLRYGQTAEASSQYQTIRGRRLS